MFYILGTFYITMVCAGYIVELLFMLFHIVPTNRSLDIFQRGIQWNYTTFLNSGFILLAIFFILRFLKTNGLKMLKMMDKPAHDM
jgi:hypothetical protein